MRAPLAFPTGLNGVGAVSFADFNNDTINDALAVAGGNALVYLGTGDGSFGAPTLIATGASSLQAVGDFNGDSSQDFAFQDNSSGALHVYWGNGDGTFAAPGNFGIVGWSLSAADLNHDGAADLVTINNGNVVVYLGDKATTLDQGPGPSSLSNVASIGLGDFTGDGNIDLFAVYPDTCNSGTCAIAVVYPGNGDGTFADTSSLTSTNLGANPCNVWVSPGYVDGDKNLDAIVTAGSTIFAVLNNAQGDGSIASAQALASDAGSGAVTGAISGSTQHDVAYTSQSGRLVLLTNNGSGGFVPQFYTNSSPYFPAFAADINNDGIDDIAVGGNTAWAAYINDGCISLPN